MYVCVYVCVCMCMCMYVYVCVCVCLCMYVYVSVCMCMHVYVCVCVCMCMCMCMCPRADNMLVGLVLLIFCCTNLIKNVFWMQFLPNVRRPGPGIAGCGRPLSDRSRHFVHYACLFCFATFYLHKLKKKRFPQPFFFQFLTPCVRFAHILGILAQYSYG